MVLLVASTTTGTLYKEKFGGVAGRHLTNACLLRWQQPGSRLGQPSARALVSAGPRALAPLPTWDRATSTPGVSSEV